MRCDYNILIRWGIIGWTILTRTNPLSKELCIVKLSCDALQLSGPDRWYLYSNKEQLLWSRYTGSIGFFNELTWKEWLLINGTFVKQSKFVAKYENSHSAEPRQTTTNKSLTLLAIEYWNLHMSEWNRAVAINLLYFEANQQSIPN